MQKKLFVILSLSLVLFTGVITCDLPVLKFRDMQTFTFHELSGRNMQYNPMMTVGMNNTVYLSAYGYDTVSSDLLYFKLPNTQNAQWESRSLMAGGLGMITTFHMTLDRNDTPQIFYKEAASFKHLTPEGGTVFPVAAGTGTFLRAAFRPDNTPVLGFTGGGMPQYMKYQGGWSGWFQLAGQSPTLAECFDFGIDDSDNIYGFVNTGAPYYLALNFRKIDTALNADVTFDNDLGGTFLSSTHDDGYLYAVYSAFEDLNIMGINLIRINKNNLNDFQIDRITDSGDSTAEFQVSNLVKDGFGTICFAYYQVYPSAYDLWSLKVVNCLADGEIVIKKLDSGSSFLGVYSGKRPAVGVDSKGNVFVAYQSVKNNNSYGKLMIAQTRP